MEPDIHSRENRSLVCTSLTCRNAKASERFEAGRSRFRLPFALEFSKDTLTCARAVTRLATPVGPLAIDSQYCCPSFGQLSRSSKLYHLGCA